MIIKKSNKQLFEIKDKTNFPNNYLIMYRKQVSQKILTKSVIAKIFFEYYFAKNHVSKINVLMNACFRKLTGVIYLYFQLEIILPQIKV